MKNNIWQDKDRVGVYEKQTIPQYTFTVWKMSWP